jgi:hypothetical protein
MLQNREKKNCVTTRSVMLPVQIESFAGGIGGAERRGFGAVRVEPGLCEEGVIYEQLTL